MKSFFNDTGRYTDDARRFAKEANTLIRPLMLKYAGEGFCPREIIRMITDQAMMTEICIRTRKRFLETV